MSPSEKEPGSLDWLRNRQAAYWLAFSTAAFVLVALVLRAFSVGPGLALAIGVVFREVTDPVLQWFLDWREVEEEVDEYAIE